MADALSLTEAAAFLGVPEHQLKLWAWDRAGPRNLGSRTKPLYDEADLQEWRNGHASSPSQNTRSQA
jgi:hypothetical protein